jgi:transposase
MPKGKYYTPEFKEQAVKMVVESTPSRTTGSVAGELDVNETTLGCWVTAYRKKMAGQPLPASMPDDERLRELERRNRELEMENAFLKKAAAYVCPERQSIGRVGAACWRRCCARDGGRPSAVALQEEAANHRELRRLRAGVVSVAEKARQRLRQVRIVKASETEPLWKRRNA